MSTSAKFSRNSGRNLSYALNVSNVKGDAVWSTFILTKGSLPSQSWIKITKGYLKMKANQMQEDNCLILYINSIKLLK